MHVLNFQSVLLSHYELVDCFRFLFEELPKAANRTIAPHSTHVAEMLSGTIGETSLTYTFTTTAVFLYMTV